MARPLPNPPDRDTPASTPRTSSRPKSVRIRAKDWARSVPIPAKYPDGRKVYDPAGLRVTLVHCSEWTNDISGYEISPRLDDWTKPGVLTQLGINVNVWRKRLSALKRLGFISETQRGNQFQSQTFVLHVDSLRTAFQPELPLENRTARHDLKQEVMPGGHDLISSEQSITEERGHASGHERDHAHVEDMPRDTRERDGHAPSVLNSFILSVVVRCNAELKIAPPVDPTIVLGHIRDLVEGTAEIPPDLSDRIVRHVGREQPDYPEGYIAKIIRTALAGRAVQRTYGAAPKRGRSAKTRARGEYTRSGYRRTSQM